MWRRSTRVLGRELGRKKEKDLIICPQSQVSLFASAPPSRRGGFPPGRGRRGGGSFRGGGRGGRFGPTPMPSSGRQDERGDEEENEDQIAADLDPFWEDDPETLNMLMPDDSRDQPLPMYKAREMVDHQMTGDQYNALEIISDPAIEENVKNLIKAEVEDFLSKMNDIYGRIPEEKKRKGKLKGGEAKIESLEGKEEEGKEGKAEISTSGIANGDVLEKEVGIAGENIEAKVESLEDKGEEEKEGKAEIVELATSGIVNGDVDGDVDGDVKEKEVEIASENIEMKMESLEDKGEEEKEGKAEVLESATSGIVDGDVKEKEENIEAEHKNAESLEADEEAVIGDTAVLSEVADSSQDETTQKVPKPITNVVEAGRRLKVAMEEIEREDAAREKEERKAKAEAEGKTIKNVGLRWQTQLVLGPGDSWHPSNRKVKLAVYVKELGLSKYAKIRLKALVGKRYNDGNDELTIVSERYQHRYENQKDVLRTLLALVDEAREADKLVENAKKEIGKTQMLNGAPLESTSGIGAQI